MGEAQRLPVGLYLRVSVTEYECVSWRQRKWQLDGLGEREVKAQGPESGPESGPEFGQ